MVAYSRLSTLDSTFETVSVKIFFDPMAGKLRLIFGDFFRSLHQLWLEVIGALFLALSVVFGASAVSEYRKGAVPWIVASAVFLSLLTFGFGIHSFWKARKLR
jgi:hypothetical protein